MNINKKKEIQGRIKMHKYIGLNIPFDHPKAYTYGFVPQKLIDIYKNNPIILYSIFYKESNIKTKQLLLKKLEEENPKTFWIIDFPLPEEIINFHSFNDYLWWMQGENQSSRNYCMEIIHNYYHAPIPASKDKHDDAKKVDKNSSEIIFEISNVSSGGNLSEKDKKRMIENSRYVTLGNIMTNIETYHLYFTKSKEINNFLKGNPIFPRDPILLMIELKRKGLYKPIFPWVEEERCIANEFFKAYPYRIWINKS